ncbi:MAG: MMPL family transporter [Bacillus sp. (in: firmicutes)]
MNKVANNVIKHFKFSIALWFLITVALGYFALGLPSKLQGDGFETEGDYEAVQAILSEDFSFPESTLLVVFKKEEGQSEDSYKAEITGTLAEIERLGVTKNIQSPLNDEELRADSLAYSVLSFDENIDEMGNNVEAVQSVTNQYDNVMLTGQPVISEDLNEASQKDLLIAEMIGLPVALIVLLAAFGSLVAAIVPLVVGGTTVLISLGILTLLGNQLNLSVFLLNVVPMIGLALSIDFSLLFINRYKEELQHSSIKEAVATTIKTAGKSIIFSAVCVFIGLGAILIIDVDIFRTVAIGGMVVVLAAVFSSLTLLPSILMAVGKHLDKGRLFKVSDRGNRKWESFAAAVMRHPIKISIMAIVLLLAAIIPVKDIVLAIPDERSLPASYESREALELLNEEFKLRETTSVYMIAKSDTNWTSEAGLKEMQRIITDLESDPAVDTVDSLFGVSETEDSSTLYQMLQQPQTSQTLSPAVEQFVQEDQLLIPLTISYGPASKEAQEFTQEWSTKDYGFDVLVGGEAKFNQEIFDEIFDKVWIGIAIVLVSTYVILLFAFQSVIIPLKAIIMNIVGLTSTFGILVWLFQGGHFGLNASDIALIIPVFVFSLVFGLSMDYEVFLISRIHENYQETGDNDKATITGLASTSKIITSAALIMIVITGAFAFTGVVPVKQIGIGIALAIFIDATIIRLLLVPSLMKLLGDWNWWFPFRKRNKSKLSNKG